MSRSVPKAIKKIARKMPGISGKIPEMKRLPAYLQLLMPSKMPDKKFLIFSQGRSGSTLLVDLLNSSPEIHCDGEILRYKVPLPKLYARACSMKSTKPIYGFKVKLIHLTADQKLKDPRQFMAGMHEQGWRIIYLKRTNVLRQEVSLQITFHRKTLGHRQAWGHKVADKPLRLTVPLDCDNLIQRLERREKFLQNEEKILKGLSHITLTYEGDLLHAENHQRTTDKLFDYLATPRVPVATQWAKSGKSELSTIIENYEEVSQTLAGTKYADLLLSD